METSVRNIYINKGIIQKYRLKMRFTQIHYFNDALFPGIHGNKNARINQANAFARYSSIKKVYFYCLTNDQNNLQRLENIFESNVVIKGLFIPFYKRENLANITFSDLKNSSIFEKALRYFFFIFLTSYLIVYYFFFFLNKSYGKSELVYVRGEACSFALYLVNIFKKVEYYTETHNHAFGKSIIFDFVHRRMFISAKKIITISNVTKENWVKNKIGSDKIQVLPSGVNINAFQNIDKSKNQLKKELQLPQKEILIGYTGSIYGGRGIEEVQTVAKMNKSYKYIIVGGNESDIAFYKNKSNPSNVLFLGNKQSHEVPLYVKCFDLVLAPYSLQCPTVHSMSPIKIIEYLASGVPILASDLPRVRDIVSKNEGYFFTPDNAQDLYKMIQFILKNKEKALIKAKNAKIKAQEFSWDNRTKRILE